MTMISNILSSPTIYNITQNTGAQVSIETGLKAIGRPGFILIDNNIDPQTKKYSAMKELLFQLTCLVVSLGVVIPVFKKGSFGIARKIFKDEKVFQAFKTSDEFNKFYKLSKENKLEKLAEINKNSEQKYTLEDINEHLAKGTIEISSIAGSVLGLSALSPIVSRPFVRPILKALGINNDKEKKEEQNNKQLNVQA